MKLLNTIFIAAGIAILALFFYQPSHDVLTGRVVQSFSASVLVEEISVDSQNPIESAQPSTDGGNISLALSITYTSQGIVNVTRSIPDGFGNCTDWQIREDGSIANVTRSGDELSWTANGSATDAALLCTAPSPTIATISEAVADDAYQQQIIVTGAVHLTGVTASIPVNGTYLNYHLYEIDGTPQDKTIAYHFAIQDGIATWSGFSLSTKEFIIIGDNTLPESAVAQRGRREFAPQHAQDTPVYAFTIYPTELLINASTSAAISIMNLGAQDNFSATSDDSAITVTSRITIPANSTGELIVTAHRPGESTVTISDGRAARSAHITVPEERATQTPATTVQPTAQEPSAIQPQPAQQQQSPQPDRISWLNIALLIIVVALGALVAWVYLCKSSDADQG